MPAVTCTRCGRALRDPKSVAVRMGRTCLRKVEAAAKTIPVAGFRPTQIQRAADLLVTGGITRRGTVYSVVSSNKTVHYLTNPGAQTCTCLAGQHGRRCYHQLAASLLAAA